MQCKDLLELVEPIAAHDLEISGAARAHIESCPACASALASARRVEALLQAWPAPQAPTGFTPAVLHRISRERWRAEQNVDRLFNLAIAAATIVIVGGVLAMLNVQAVFSISATLWAFLKDRGGELVREAAPAVATYVAAAGLLASAVGMWWWAERRLESP